MSTNVESKIVRRTGRQTVVLLAGIYILDYVDRVMIAVALPLIAQEFGLTHTQQGFVVSAFAITYMISQLPGGLLADRVGARPLLLISLVAWSVFTAATGFASSLVILLALRGLFGIAQALFPSASFKALAERTTRDMRSRAAGVMLASNMAGAGLAPSIAAPLMVLAGWRPTFWLVAAGGLIIGAALWKFLPRPLPRELTEADDESETAPAPVPVSHVLRNGLVLRCALMFACVNMLNYGMIAWVPSYLVEAKGMSLVSAGLASAIPLLISAIGVVAGGWLMSRRFDRRPRQLIVPALVVSAALLTAMLLAGSTTMFTVLQTLAMFISALALIGITGMPLRVLPRDVVGTGMGVFNTGGQIAGILAPLVMGWLVDQFGYIAAFGFLAATTLAGAVIAVTTRPQNTRLGTRAPTPTTEGAA